jgi:DNA repair protein RadA/Sms
VSKRNRLFECENCRATFPAWAGLCAECGEWNTLKETVLSAAASPTHIVKKTLSPTPITKIDIEPQPSYPTCIQELDRVLGTGFIKGSVTLLGGEPGIGKSTLSLQLSTALASQGLKILIITGEESIQQIHLRAKRLDGLHASVSVYAQTNIDEIIKVLNSHQPDIVVLDSIQVIYHPELTAAPGTIGQVRQSANLFINWVKENNGVGIIISHITKDGSIAGPKVLEHLVDVILYFEGERSQVFRLLRCYKNRFSGTNEVGIFEMKKEGLVEITSPSELFIGETKHDQPGSIVSAITEGNRILLIEVQALVVSSGFGMPKRNVVGVNTHRANLIIATLEKIMSIPLHKRDIFLNIIGGLKVDDTSLDLAILISIMSSYHDRVPGLKVAAIGEVGLTGETRSVSRLEQRLMALSKMGYTHCYVPEISRRLLTSKLTITPVYCSHIRDVITHFLSLQHV